MKERSSMLGKAKSVEARNRNRRRKEFLDRRKKGKGNAVRG